MYKKCNELGLILMQNFILADSEQAIYNTVYEMFSFI